MPPQRKYFKSGIAELRDICNQNKENIEVLREVYDELCFRKTRAAVELRDKLEDYLDKNSSKNNTEIISD
mgnify:CR=1 FL=1